MSKNKNAIQTIEERISLFNSINENAGDLLKSLSLDWVEEEHDDSESTTILDVRNVQKYYSTSKKVLDQITFKVNKGEFFGIVGESGSGKSTLGKIIIRIIGNSGGTILFDNRFISSKKLLKPTKKWLSENIQMVFQSPISSLNPKKKVLDLIKEPLLRSSLIDNQVDSLIDIHKRLNYLFEFRIQLLMENFHIDFLQKYYAILIFSYFTFKIKFAIYEYYVNHKNKKDIFNKFIHQISAISNKYTSDTQIAKNAFLGPLYKVDNIDDLNIYDNVSLDQQQAQELWNNFINDDELLDSYGINFTSSIHGIDDFFNSLSEADDFIIEAVDELDNNVKLLLNITTKYFTNITDITRLILKKITRQEFYPKEKEIILAYNEMEKRRAEYENNTLYSKINKLIAKKQKMLDQFEENFKNITGLNAQNILVTYLSTSKEEIASVNRSMVNHSNDPIMFAYYEIKRDTLKERFNVIKTLNNFKNLTANQIDFLIEKVWDAIKEKYQPLYDDLRTIQRANVDGSLTKEAVAERLVQLKANLAKKWNEYGKELPQYKLAVLKAKQWGNDNIQLLNDNKKRVNEQVEQLTAINDKLQSELKNNSDYATLQENYFKSKKIYEDTIPQYIEESQQLRKTNADELKKLKEKSKNIVQVFDAKTIKLMNFVNSRLNALPSKIKNNAKIYKSDREAVVNDIKRVQEGMASTFLEVQEILNNTKTYSQLYTKNNLSIVRKKLIKNLTKLYVFDTLESVGLKQEHAFRYIYEFSGGQRQRIAIARSIVTHPKLIIADEPISALDVSIQAQVVNIMKNLAKERNITFLFIAHDLSMVHYACDRMIIINKGHILEKGNTNAIFEHPGHPYTRTLLKAVPELSNINLNLALESDKVYQPYGDYNPIENPRFYSISKLAEHYVYGVREEIEQWNPNLKLIIE